MQAHFCHDDQIPKSTHRAVVAKMNATIKEQQAQIVNLTANADMFSNEAAGLRKKLAQVKDLPRIEWQAERYMEICIALNRPRGDDVVGKVKDLAENIRRLKEDYDATLRVAVMHDGVLAERNAQCRELMADIDAAHAVINDGTSEGMQRAEADMSIAKRVNLALQGAHQDARREAIEEMLAILKAMERTAHATSQGIAENVLFRAIERIEEELAL